jgi:hypothetical protein
MSLNTIYASQLEIPVPDTWQDRSVHTFVSTSENNPSFRTNLVIARERKDKDIKLDTYADTQLATLKAQFPNLQVDETTRATISAKPALNRVFHFTANPHALAIQQLQVFVMTEHWVYTLTFSTTPETFASERKLFTDMIANMRLA